MSLTRGGGPLATPGPERVDSALDAPPHRLLLHRYDAPFDEALV